MKPAMNPYAPDQDLEDFILADGFPCVGAKAAIGQKSLSSFAARDILCADDDVAIHDALMVSTLAASQSGQDIWSFVVLFEAEHDLDEEAFEIALWTRLEGLAAVDVARGIPWSSEASSDPDDRNYAMSVGGHSFFVVGLHPRASRAARRFSRCAMVFNAHAQFDALRRDGRYQRFQKVNQSRELKTHGSLNPMLGTFGEVSEARQYSGRAVTDTWTCPFARGKAND
jgi:uncharacterized protein